LVMALDAIRKRRETDEAASVKPAGSPAPAAAPAAAEVPAERTAAPEPAAAAVPAEPKAAADSPGGDRQDAGTSEPSPASGTDA
jgi:hypothetical protein